MFEFLMDTLEARELGGSDEDIRSDAYCLLSFRLCVFKVESWTVSEPVPISTTDEVLFICDSIWFLMLISSCSEDAGVTSCLFSG